MFALPPDEDRAGAIYKLGNKPLLNNKPAGTSVLAFLNSRTVGKKLLLFTNYPRWLFVTVG